MSEWLSFRSRAKGKAFSDAVAAFKALVPSVRRRWDPQHGYWLFDPSFAGPVEAVGDVRGATTLAEDDRVHGRVSVRDDEQLDCALVDMQHGDPAERQEFERRLREAER